MKTLHKVIIGLAVGIPLTVYLAYIYIIGNYDFSVADISVNGINGNTLSLNINVNISSNIGIQFAISNIYFDIYIQGYKVGNVNQDENIVIPNKGVVPLLLTANVDISQIQTNAGSILISGVTGNGNNYNVSLVGYTRVQVGGIPITANVAISEGYQLSI